MPEVSNSDLSGFPYSAVGLIRATFSDGSTVVGVGSVIGKNDVITALSLIYDPDLGWATAIDFYFGADYNVSTGRFDNLPYSPPSNTRWSAKGYPSQLFSDSNNSTFLQSEAQYNIAVIGLSEEIGLRTGWFGLDPNRDSNGQTFSTIGFSSSQGMVSFQTSVDKSATAGVYVSATNPYLEQANRSSGSPLFTADNYLVGVRASTTQWADIGFLYEYITSKISSNDSLIAATIPTVSIEGASVVEGDSGTRDLVFEVSLSNPSPEDVTLTVRTWAGTASTGSGDYNGFYERVIIISAGQVSFNLTIEINGDDLFEPNEGFAVEI